MEFVEAIEATMDDIANACEACGKCFTACPMTEAIGIDDAEPTQVLHGMIDLLRGGKGTAEAATWASACSSSGICAEACDYGVDPRMLVRLANYARIRTDAGPQVKANAMKSFRAMAKTVRIVSRLQLPQQEIDRLQPPKGAQRVERPDVALYTGCNIHKTPHILVLCLDVLERIGASYQVIGGTSACCGINQFRSGDGETSGRAGLSTLAQIQDIEAKTQVSWCPSCQSQFDEIIIPNYQKMKNDRTFGLQPFYEYLEENLDRLRPHFTQRVEKTVALNERPGLRGVTRAVKNILAAIPGVELVELDVPRVGLMSNYLTVTPRFKDELREIEFRAAAQAGVTTLATVFHACHRELCHFEKNVSFEIINVMEIIGQSMGLHADDIYKRIKMMDGVDRMIGECSDLIVEHALDPNEARDILLADQLAAKPVQGPAIENA
ncbi:(Fe-S)-binding protein [Puniceibacterium sp. IMCC21224]|uniref:(Fe-S)-binding protein n=1 Tax=Puniceibacterium sp. IMCC21224 TaxID=1618204 RepID=UPI00064DC961|nr:(Fe-S)-binding protein [Puniceibacterium sp. IMCC21224]KMK69080.1 Fe-S oxidoreductase [Puniceibacterium sp. IMCC21224]